jgi:two-component system response regulator FlrC
VPAVDTAVVAAAGLAGGLALAERDLIRDAVRVAGNRLAAAKTLGISARTLRYRIARLRDAGIDVSFRGSAA